MTRLRCAVLDDYQNVALSLADWSRIAEHVEVVTFHEAFVSRDDAAGALKGFEIVCAMR